MNKPERNKISDERRKSFTKSDTSIGGSKNLLWTVLFIFIAAATVWAVMSQSRTFSAGAFIAYIADAKKVWIICAALCTLGFIFFEGEAIVFICRALGYPAGHGRGFLYSASDIYFSGITPSASGGQPACAYFMIKDGVPASITTLALLLNLAMYTLSIVIISLAVLIAEPQIFLSFGTMSKILIVIGYFIQSLLAAFFIMLMLKRGFLHGICRNVIRFLCRIKLLKDEDKKQSALDRYMEEYATLAQLIRQKKGVLAVGLIFNIMQRVAIISVPLFVFLATGGAVSESAKIWAVQSYSVIGSNSIPIPGAMGVSDYIMLDGYKGLMPYEGAVNFELLSRSISFYICIILCGAAVFIKYMTYQRRIFKK